MAPKEKDAGNAKKKTPKQLQALAGLTAFTNTYKAACKKYGVNPDKGLLADAEQKTLICKPLEKVSLRGPQHDSGSLTAVLEGMAGYAGVKNLACWGCNIGDEGLHALARLMRASADKIWIGSKPRLIEIVNDGAQVPAERWPERYMLQANGLGGTVTRGPGFQLPSLVLGHAQAVTLDTVLLQPDSAVGSGAAGLDLASLERQLSNLMASTSAVTTLLYDKLDQARAGAEAAAAATTIGSGGGSGAAALGQAARHPADGRPLLHAPPPMAFSPGVLKELSLSLGAQGHMLQVLILDHNHLGDVGAKLLAPGLKRCAPLKQLSLAHCGIGPEGAAALAATLAPDPIRHLAAVQPQYKVLNLSYNPLCAAGVRALAGGLAHVASLKVLLLASVELGGERPDMDALSALADCLAANVSIDQVDLDANPIGDVGATVLLPFLQAQKHIRKFRISPRISRAAMEAIKEAVRANLPKKKLVKKTKKGAGAGAGKSAKK